MTQKKPERTLEMHGQRLQRLDRDPGQGGLSRYPRLRVRHRDVRRRPVEMDLGAVWAPGSGDNDGEE